MILRLITEHEVQIPERGSREWYDLCREVLDDQDDVIEDANTILANDGALAIWLAGQADAGVHVLVGRSPYESTYWGATVIDQQVYDPREQSWDLIEITCDRCGHKPSDPEDVEKVMIHTDTEPPYQAHLCRECRKENDDVPVGG